jgi:hypothetical protein
VWFEVMGLEISKRAPVASKVISELEICLESKGLFFSKNTTDSCKEGVEMFVVLRSSLLPLVTGCGWFPLELVAKCADCGRRGNNELGCALRPVVPIKAKVFQN